MKEKKECVMVEKRLLHPVREAFIAKANGRDIISLPEAKHCIGYYFHVPKELRPDWIKVFIRAGIIEPYPIKSLQWFNFRILD